MSLAQLDSSATKSISSRPDLFSHILPTPDARVRVADGRELGGIIGEGPLKQQIRVPRHSCQVRVQDKRDPPESSAVGEGE